MCSSASRSGPRPAASVVSLLERPRPSLRAAGIEPGRLRPRHVGLVQARRLRVADPERQLHPLADALLGQERRPDPDEARVAAGHLAAGLEQLAPGDPGGSRCTSPPCASRRADEPVAEVAHVDELHLSLRRRRSEHVAAASDPCGQYVKRPVGSCGPTIRPAARGARSGEDRLGDSLAERLQRAVVREVAAARRADLVELGDGLVLVGRLAKLGVDGDARDEEVVAGRVGEQLGRRSTTRGT